jgi:hypothetical protein
MQRCRVLLSWPGSAQVDSASTTSGSVGPNQLCGHVAKLCVGTLGSVDEHCECLVRMPFASSMMVRDIIVVRSRLRSSLVRAAASALPTATATQAATSSANTRLCSPADAVWSNDGAVHVRGLAGRSAGLGRRA